MSASVHQPIRAKRRFEVSLAGSCSRFGCIAPRSVGILRRASSHAVPISEGMDDYIDDQPTRHPPDRDEFPTPHIHIGGDFEEGVTVVDVTQFARHIPVVAKITVAKRKQVRCKRERGTETHYHGSDPRGHPHAIRQGDETNEDDGQDGDRFEELFGSRDVQGEECHLCLLPDVRLLLRRTAKGELTNLVGNSLFDLIAPAGFGEKIINFALVDAVPSGDCVAAC